MKLIVRIILGIVFTAGVALAAQASPLDEIQSDWARIKYRLAQAERADAYALLADRAHEFSRESEQSPEALIWEAIVLSSYAGEKGGLGALSRVKEARQLLEQAEAIDPSALGGSIYVSLGSLYYQVPGWPLGFGDDEKAEDFLTRALEINPDGIDANYFYGDFLYRQERYQEAAAAFEKALNAPDRPGRALADEGRRAEAREGLENALRAR